MKEILYKDLAYAVVGAAMEVHRCLGSGFLERVYRKALARELDLQGIAYDVHRSLPVQYKDIIVGEYEADMVVDGKFILELKAASAISPAHIAQVHHYLAATGLRLGIILDFGTESLQSKRVIK